jgi:hypothetical protein
MVKCFIIFIKLCDSRIYTLKHDFSLILLIHTELTCPSVMYVAIWMLNKLQLQIQYQYIYIYISNVICYFIVTLYKL